MAAGLPATQSLFSHLLFGVGLGLVFWSSRLRADPDPACPEYVTRNHWRHAARVAATIWRRTVG